MPASSPLSSPSPDMRASLKAYPSSPHSSASTFASNSNKSSDMDIDVFSKANNNANGTINTTPNTSTSSTRTSNTQKRAVAEIIAESFPSFNHQAAVVGPYEEEQKRDTEFKEQLASKLLSLVLKTHAWSPSRPTYQSEHEAGVLEKDINDVIAREQEQGRSSESHHLCGPSSSSQHSCTSLAGRHITYAIHLEEGGVVIPSRSNAYPRSVFFLSCSRVKIALIYEERTRERLRDFVARIKLALAALTGL